MGDFRISKGNEAMARLKQPNSQYFKRNLNGLKECWFVNQKLQ